MSKYEIMLMIDPKENIDFVSKLVEEVFTQKAEKIEKLPFSELAYAVNKSMVATYILINISATGDQIKEFRRRANISKTVWRELIINLDKERGLAPKPKSKYKLWAEAKEEQKRNAYEAQQAQRRAERAERMQQYKERAEKARKEEQAK